MKKTGIINPQIAGALAGLGHSDGLLICDAGFPLPQHLTAIDISLVFGTPTVLQTLDAVLTEFIAEEVIVSKEMESLSPALYKAVRERLPKQKYRLLPFDEFAAQATGVKYALRTGDNTAAYANIIITAASGVEEYYRDFL
jgi:D-ribose pyranase